MTPSSAALSTPFDPQLNIEMRGPATTGGGRPIDLVHLTRQTFGDRHLETELLRLFMRQSDQIRHALTPAPDDDARHAVPPIDLLHMLAGSARVIGAGAIAALAGSLEAEMRRDPHRSIAPAERLALDELIGCANRYIVELLEQG